MLDSIQKNFTPKIYKVFKYKEPENIPVDNSRTGFSTKIPIDKLGIFKTFQIGGRKKSVKQTIMPNYFYIRMKEYERNFDWANSMSIIAAETSKKISNKQSFEDVLEYICQKTKDLSFYCNYADKKGQYTTYFTIEKDEGRGSEYWERYNDKLKKIEKICPVSNSKYNNANTCAIVKAQNNTINVIYPYFRKSTKSNLDLCAETYKELILKTEPTAQEVLDACATIQWLIYQECPFWKGNDSIANLLTKSIMHSYDLQLSPVKKGVSLDFEAFDTDLNDYIKKYPTFFEKYPVRIK